MRRVVITPYRQAQHPRHTTDKLNEFRDVATATSPLQNVLKGSCANASEPLLQEDLFQAVENGVLALGIGLAGDRTGSCPDFP